MAGKFTDVMKAAKDEKQKASLDDGMQSSEDVRQSPSTSQKAISKDAEQKTSKDDGMLSAKEEKQKTSSDELVNVCIKVPKSLRKKWTIEAAQADMTLKDRIVEAMAEHWPD